LDKICIENCIKIQFKTIKYAIKIFLENENVLFSHFGPAALAAQASKRARRALRNGSGPTCARATAHLA
jgi:hypothetical protein